MVGRITIKMKSDWHIGSGTGQPGNIDRLILRDADKLPYIPAKTLTGILRDGCERVAFGLDEGRQGVWHQWVDFLFGDQPALSKEPIETAPRPAALSVRPAQLPETLRNALKGKNKLLLKEALTFIKPGISIEPNTGCTRTDFLRFEEMVRLDATLIASYTLPDNVDRAAIALLVAGAAMIERLGAKRRRGVGRCQINLDGNLEEELKWIESNLGKISPPSRPIEESKKADQIVQNQSGLNNQGSWYYIDLILQVKSPLIISKRTVGNLVETLDYIPGTCLLSIISKKLQRQGIKLGDAIAQNQILVTHATLEVDGVKGRPVPFALFSEKLNKNQFYNLLRFSQKEQEGKPQLKGARSGYIAVEKLETVEKTVQTHNTVDDEQQRPNENVGGVYTYEAIAPGTRLRAQLRLQSQCLEEIKTKHPNWLNYLMGVWEIGRSSKDDYGLVSVEFDGELKEGFCSKNPCSLLIVWLLSDVLLRDKRLRPTASLKDFQNELEKYLQVKLKEREQSNLMSMSARQNRTESWQMQWGLPRPSLVGLASGTCIVYKVIGGKIAPEKLAELETTGIGERRAEGYGQLCFNDPLLMKKQFTVSESQKSDPSTNTNFIQDNDTSFEYASIIEREAWRKAIENEALALASNRIQRQEILGIKITEELDSKPSLTQLGALRSVLAKLTKPSDLRVMSWFESVKQVTNRWETWEHSLPKIEDLVIDHRIIWQKLKLPSADLTLTQGGDEILRTQLWSYAVQVLVDACIRAHKREIENRER